MNALVRRIARAIETDGPMPISTFMTLALHDPQCGFYASRDPIGAGGAFITAPEISQMFGELLGLWCAQVWEDQNRPENPQFIELGPGRGTLMRDALRALRGAPAFLESVEVVLVEVSSALEATQRERLRDAGVPIRWQRHCSGIAQDRPIFLLANEFLDSLPIRQFVMTARGWCERVVTANSESGLEFSVAPLPLPLSIPQRRGRAAPGAVYEVAPAADQLVEDIARAVAARGGAALFVDYGYAGEGFEDTLQALARHAPVHVLDAPGEADISAHVDFAAVATAARRSGAHVFGPVGQGSFLGALGMEVRAAKLAAANPSRADDVQVAVARLTGPREMGELFKILAVMPPETPPPPGF
jgi:NADH dehydrogenase [ubiquinone] 1 alpha subcomplex assembly factor 7